jgi:hypothetical protein
LVQKNIGEIFDLMDMLSERRDELRLDNISEFHYDPDIGVTLHLRSGGLEIRMGFQPYAEKIRRLAKVMEYLKKEDLLKSVSYFNLECVPRVVTRFAGGRSPESFRKDESKGELDGRGISEIMS